MQDLQNAKYVLKPERTPEYVAFLKRLLCPDASARYTAAEALMDEWILAGEEPMVNQRLLDEMDTESVVVPAGYAPDEWTAQVRGIISSKNGDRPEVQGDDAESAF
jgi:serine/threonine protein kinase